MVGVTVVLFGDYPWNRHVPEPLTYGIVRARDWPELVGVLRQVAAPGRGSRRRTV
jgi:hypothetical protein